MKITIDTKEDSHDEIRKVVKMLQAWADSHTENRSYTNIFESGSSGPDSSPSQANSGSQDSDSSSEGLFNIFGDSSSGSSDNNDSVVEDVLNSDQQDDDSPEIITY